MLPVRGFKRIANLQLVMISRFMTFGTRKQLDLSNNRVANHGDWAGYWALGVETLVTACKSAATYGGSQVSWPI